MTLCKHCGKEIIEHTVHILKAPVWIHRHNKLEVCDISPDWEMLAEPEEVKEMKK